MTININKELHSRLFLQQEEQRNHVEYNHEYVYYENVADGNIEEVKKVLSDPEKTHIYENSEYGQLSKDMLRNIRYHFIVSVALITRECVKKGLERELAYTLSDLYISKMDMIQSAKEILMLQNEMLMDFTHKMSELPKKTVYSIQIVKAIEYVYHHRTEHINVESISDKLNINRSYLSTLFKKETGKSLGSFIRSEKVKAAANMLRFSDFTYSDIAQYFGFASQSHFIQCFRTETGLTPHEYRKKYYRSQ